MKKNLKQRRKALKISQSDLVKLIQERSNSAFSQQAYSKLEKNPDAESKYMVYVLEVLDELEGNTDAMLKEVREIMESLPAAYQDKALQDLRSLRALIDEDV